MIDWNAIRAQFPVTERCIYLNTGWSGPSSRSVVTAMEQRAEREAYDGPTSPEVRNEKALLVRETRASFASLIGADEDELALMYTTTEGVNTVVRGLGLSPGDEILTCNLEHNAVMIPSYMARLRDGVSVNIARFRSTETAAEMVDGFAAAMTPATRLLVLSQISWNRGTRLPMREICDLAHDRGALVCVDAAQSAGHIAIDVREMGCDFLAMPGHKWLLGPDGAAALYVRREHIERLQPLAVVHGANRQYDYDGHFDYAEDTIHKFELTTHSGPVLAGLRAAFAMTRELGLPAVEARCLSIATRFLEAVRTIDGVRITTPVDASVRSGIVTFELSDANPNEVCAALWQQARIVGRVCNDRRVRLCFSIFNDESEADSAVAALAEIAAHGIPAGTPTEADYKAQQLDAED